MRTRGGLEPFCFARLRNSQAARQATTAVITTKRIFGARNTIANTSGIRTSAVRMRFMPNVRIHRQVSKP